MKNIAHIRRYLLAALTLAGYTPPADTSISALVRCVDATRRITLGESSAVDSPELPRTTVWPELARVKSRPPECADLYAVAAMQGPGASPAPLAAADLRARLGRSAAPIAPPSLATLRAKLQIA